MRIEEKYLRYKRKYKQHPSLFMGGKGSVRDKVVKEIGNKTISKEKFKNIIAKYSNHINKWIRRNSQFFDFKQGEKITLSRLGKNALKAIENNYPNHIVKERYNMPSMGFEDDISVFVIPLEYKDNVISVYYSEQYDSEKIYYDIEYFDGNKALMVYFEDDAKQTAEYFYYDLIDAGIPDAEIEITAASDDIELSNNLYTDFEQFINENLKNS
jgi:hypothetical protein